MHLQRGPAIAGPTGAPDLRERPCTVDPGVKSYEGDGMGWIGRGELLLRRLGLEVHEKPR